MIHPYDVSRQLRILWHIIQIEDRVYLSQESPYEKSSIGIVDSPPVDAVIAMIEQYHVAFVRQPIVVDGFHDPWELLVHDDDIWLQSG